MSDQKNDYDTVIRYVEKNSANVAKIIFKDAKPVPIGYVVPRYADKQEEALEEADQWFNDDLPLELWPASWAKGVPDGL